MIKAEPQPPAAEAEPPAPQTEAELTVELEAARQQERGERLARRGRKGKGHLAA